MEQARREVSSDREGRPSSPEVTPVPSDWALEFYRGTRRMLSRNPVIRMAVALPRTLRFVADNLERRVAGEVGDLPAPTLSPGLAAHVAMDEAILGLAMGPNRFPRRADYLRVGRELSESRELYSARGWLADPASYHRAPPPLARPVITPGWTLTPDRSLGLRYQRLHFESEFEPHPGEPGRDRWLRYAPNRTAGAWVLAHSGASRPWLLCLHGFGMGYAVMDFAAFNARYLHEDLGFNLVFPVLPLHGHRKVTPLSGEAFLSFDLVNTVHGLAQAVWDVRRLLSWVREQSPTAIGVYGLSLGAYTAALLAGLDGELDCLIAGIPVCDFPDLFREHSPRHIRLRAIEHKILGGAAEDTHRVVSPLFLPTRVAPGRRFIFAGLGDRVAFPTQAHKLWQHWEKPPVLWYRGNHVGYLWSGEVRRFVGDALEECGLVRSAARALG